MGVTAGVVSPAGQSRRAVGPRAGRAACDLRDAPCGERAGGRGGMRGEPSGRTRFSVAQRPPVLVRVTLPAATVGSRRFFFFFWLDSMVIGQPSLSVPQNGKTLAAWYGRTSRRRQGRCAPRRLVCPMFLACAITGASIGGENALFGWGAPWGSSGHWGSGTPSTVSGRGSPLSFNCAKNKYIIVFSIECVFRVAELRLVELASWTLV